MDPPQTLSPSKHGTNHVPPTALALARVETVPLNRRHRNISNCGKTLQEFIFAPLQRVF
jgi:hypothetical protein